jgi:hypothetical protein
VQRSIISELTSGALTSVMPQWIKFEIWWKHDRQRQKKLKNRLLKWL